MQVNRIFGECLVHSGLHERSGMVTVKVLSDAFACMRARLEESKTSRANQAVFTQAIARAIQADPELADSDKEELQAVLRSTFAEVGDKLAVTPLRAVSSRFLSRVVFSAAG
jgi:hypothetical protein